MNYLGTVAGRHLRPRDTTTGGRFTDRTMAAMLAPLLAPLFLVLMAIWEPSHWHPLWLVVVLALLTVLGELHAVRIGRVYVSSSTTALLLALALLGPAPAVAIAAGSAATDWLVHRKPLSQGVANVIIAAAATVVGALVLETLAPRVGGAGGRLAGAVLVSGVLMVAANVIFLGGYRRFHLGESFWTALNVTYLPASQFHLVGIALAAGTAQLVVNDDLPVVAAVVTIVLADFLVRAVAADRARIEELVELTRERAELLECALTAEVAEREWIAGHVHDEALQTLAVARQDLDDAIDGDRASLVCARDHLDDAVKELRRTLVHVHPGSVTGHGIGSSLDAYASQALRRGGATWSIDVQPGAGDGHEALLYSIGRELLSNAGKHASATHVRLRLSRDEAAIRLVVEDDGIGFTANDAAMPGHFGLLTTRRRVAAASGQMTISRTGAGARIDVELPVGPAERRQ